MELRLFNEIRTFICVESDYLEIHDKVKTHFIQNLKKGTSDLLMEILILEEWKFIMQVFLVQSVMTRGLTKLLR